MKKTKLLLVLALAAVLATGCGSKQTEGEVSTPDYSNIKVNIPEDKPEHVTIAKDALTEFAVSDDTYGNCPLVYNPEDGMFHLGTYDGTVLESKPDMAYEGNGDTVTLKGFNYTSTFTPAVIFEKDTKIILEEGSSNYIAVQADTDIYDADYTSALYALNNLSIDGDGILYATYPDNETDSCAVRVRGDLSVNKAMFYPYSAASGGTNVALYADGDVSFTESNSAVTASDSVITTGIKCKNLSFTDSTISITAGSATDATGEMDAHDILSSGIITSENVTSTNSTVSVESSNSDGASEAINVGKDINVTGGTFNGIAGVANRSAGIMAGGDINITGAYSAGRVSQANFYAYGIYAKGDINIDGAAQDTCITADTGSTYTEEDTMSCALLAKGSFTQNGGTVIATAGESGVSRGLAAVSGVDFKFGTLTAFGFESLIICDDGVISVADGTEVFGPDNDFVSGETKSLWSNNNNSAFFNKAE